MLAWLEDSLDRTETIECILYLGVLDRRLLHRPNVTSVRREHWRRCKTMINSCSYRWTADGEISRADSLCFLVLSKILRVNVCTGFRRRIIFLSFASQAHRPCRNFSKSSSSFSGSVDTVARRMSRNSSSSSLQRRLNVYIEFSEHMHLPFAHDADLKEHAERCLAFDQGTQVFCSSSSSPLPVSFFSSFRTWFLENRFNYLLGRWRNTAACIEHISKELSTCLVILHGILGLSHPVRLQISREDSQWSDFRQRGSTLAHTFVMHHCQRWSSTKITLGNIHSIHLFGGIIERRKEEEFLGNRWENIAFSLEWSRNRSGTELVSIQSRSVH